MSTQAGSRPLDRLVILRAMREDPVVSALGELLATDESDAEVVTSAYAELAHLLFEAQTHDLRGYVLGRAVDDDNVYTRATCRGESVEGAVRAALETDLRNLQEACDRVSELFGRDIWGEATVPAIRMGDERNLVAAYHRRMAALGSTGRGSFASHTAFLLDDAASIVPATNPDHVRLDDIVGYEDQKDVLVRNARALLGGSPAADVLAYGASGTGKSAMVKAVVNELSDQGLRILEVGQQQLAQLPSVLASLADNPLRFVVLVDDLRFDGEDVGLATLEHVLEGSVQAKPSNVMVCVTTSRVLPALVSCEEVEADVHDVPDDADAGDGAEAAKVARAEDDAEAEAASGSDEAPDKATDGSGMGEADGGTDDKADGEAADEAEGKGQDPDGSEPADELEEPEPADVPEEPVVEAGAATGLAAMGALAERFALRVAFMPPDEREYLAIVRGIARRRELRAVEEDLDRLAIEFARGEGGMSGRRARQFVDAIEEGLIEVERLAPKPAPKHAESEPKPQPEVEAQEPTSAATQEPDAKKSGPASVKTSLTRFLKRVKGFLVEES